MLSPQTVLGVSLLSAFLVRNGARKRAEPVPLAARLANLPLRGAPLERPLRISWSEHQIPYVDAETDRDVAVGIGVVHAHLRLCQMEFMRRVATGRLAEVAGPVAVDLDRALRILQVGRAVPAMEAALPEETRTWLGGFVDGINHVIANSPALPPEFALLQFRPEPWTVADVLCVSRLAAVDFSWKVWMRLLRHYLQPDWMEAWQRLMEQNVAPVPGFTGAEAGGAAALAALLGGFGRDGSNSFIVGAAKSASGAPLIASDPHLSMGLPNVWLILGFHSPTYHAVGVMVPGIPLVALGRNHRIAWGGTSLHAASSDLFDVGGLTSAEITERRETIRVRWWRDEQASVRETRFGPIISDAPGVRVPQERTLALRWVGHMPTDETTAMVRVIRAGSWKEFREAIDSFAVPALTLTYADVDGHIGQAMAARLPRRPHTPPADLVAEAEAHLHWDSMVGPGELLARVDPPEGFVASANNRPPEATTVPVGFFFSPEDRVARLRAVLGASGLFSLADMAALQEDVFVASALELRDDLIALALHKGKSGRHGASSGRTLKALARWDGRYDADSRGALVFEFLVCNLIRTLHGKRSTLYAGALDPWSFLREDLRRMPRPKLQAAFEQAARRTSRALRHYRVWGDAHRLRLSHTLAALPGLTRAWRFVDLPAGGSNETLMKTAHGISGKRHAVRFGAVARHVSDLADPDANWFVLLGGQDGWLGSTTFVDQLPVWRAGRLLQVPLQPETAHRLFPHTTELRPD